LTWADKRLQPVIVDMKPLEKMPDNAQALYEYGVCLTNRGRPSEALPKRKPGSWRCSAHRAS